MSDEIYFIRNSIIKMQNLMKYYWISFCNLNFIFRWFLYFEVSKNLSHFNGLWQWYRFPTFFSFCIIQFSAVFRQLLCFSENLILAQHPAELLNVIITKLFLKKHCNSGIQYHIKVPGFYCLMKKFKWHNFLQKIFITYFDKSWPNSSRFVENHDKNFFVKNLWIEFFH